MHTTYSLESFDRSEKTPSDSEAMLFDLSVLGKIAQKERFDIYLALISIPRFSFSAVKYNVRNAYKTNQFGSRD